MLDEDYFIALVTDTIEEALQNVGMHNKTDFNTKTHIFNSLLLGEEFMRQFIT